jgi:hypothetical protein
MAGSSSCFIICWRPVGVADFVAKKNGYFYIIYEICENIDIALYMYMFLWN